MLDLASEFDPIRKRHFLWYGYDQLVEFQNNKAAKANAEAAAQKKASDDAKRNRPQRFGG